MLPLSKLYNTPMQVRFALKKRQIATCDQLLAIAGQCEARKALARASRIDLEILTTMVRRADMARVRGIGTVFSRMLEDLGILDVAMLAVHDQQMLHEHLRSYNEAQRLARRSPTPAEVMDWIEQARSLAKLVSYEPQGTTTASSASVATVAR